MKEFHCVLGNKGGVGKSVVASWLIQHATDAGNDVLGIECDQSNRTLTRYQRLRTQRLDLLDSEHQVDRRRFDSLIEMLVADKEPFVVMDNGQASFRPLSRYMTECRAFDILRDSGRQCFVHAVVTGGQLGASTLAGFNETVTGLGGDAHVVVWHNEHFGPVDDKEYQKVVTESHTRVVGPVRLLLWSKPFEDDVQDMLKGFLTFEEAIASPNFGLMNRQRLTIVRDHVFGALQQSLAVLDEEARDVE